jgi:hypothetical protein
MCLKPTIISTPIFSIEQSHPHLDVYKQACLFDATASKREKRVTAEIVSFILAPTCFICFCKGEETHTRKTRWLDVYKYKEADNEMVSEVSRGPLLVSPLWSTFIVPRRWQELIWAMTNRVV